MKNHFSLIFTTLLFISALLPSCKKDDEKPLVTVTSDPVTRISRTSCAIKGSLINEGTDTVIAFGFCWSTKPQPDFADNKIVPEYMTNGNTKNGTFQGEIRGLSPGATYYVKAYAITVENKIYGNQESFTTKAATVLTTFNPGLIYQTVSDVDGNSYKTIKIGTQEWLAENLKTTRFNDGTVIPLVTDENRWSRMSSPAYCWYNNDEAVFKNIYGGYYNWHAVNTGKLCPAGWHVPGEDDWKVLKLFLGMTSEQIESDFFPETTSGNKIKETGTLNWIEGSVTATNESGFTALPGGSRSDSNFYFGGEGEGAGWWSASLVPVSGYSPYSHWVISDKDWFYRSDMLNANYGLNVRCVKN